MGSGGYEKNSFGDWLGSKYTFRLVFTTVFIFSFLFVFSLDSFWGSSTYPEEAYQLLEQVAKDSIDVQEKNIDFSAIPRSVQYSVIKNDVTKTYSDLNISYKTSIYTDYTKLKYSIEYENPPVIGSDISITVKLDDGFNIISFERNDYGTHYKLKYWSFKIFLSALLAIMCVLGLIFGFIIILFIIALFSDMYDNIKEKHRKNKLEFDEDEDDYEDENENEDEEDDDDNDDNENEDEIDNSINDIDDEDNNN